MKTQNKTSRGKGAVGPNALVPRYVKANIPKDWSILDFGAGKDAPHAEMLRASGFESVTAWDYGSNVTKGLHDERALSRKYDCVYASNVLNVQTSWQDVVELFEVFPTLLAKHPATFICNLPLSPRKSAWAYMGEKKNADESWKEKQCDLLAFRDVLWRFFYEIEVVGGTRLAPVVRCSGVIKNHSRKVLLSPISILNKQRDGSGD